jgi:hypothetical protein
MMPLVVALKGIEAQTGGDGITPDSYPIPGQPATIYGKP